MISFFTLSTIFSFSFFITLFNKKEISFLDGLLNDTWKHIRKDIKVKNMFYAGLINRSNIYYKDKFLFETDKLISELDDYKNEILNAISNLHNNN